MAKFNRNLDLCFAALGDPTRRQILERLTRGSATVSELAAPHDMALPSFMAHLRKLEEAGLVTTEKTGRIRTCTLSDDAFLPVRTWLQTQAQLWESRLDRLDAYAIKLAKERAK